MTKNILLALTLVLAPASIASPAFACGGYSVPPGTHAVRDTVQRYVVEHVSAYTTNSVHGVRIVGDRAEAIVRLETRDRAIERALRAGNRLDPNRWF